MAKKKPNGGQTKDYEIEFDGDLENLITELSKEILVKDRWNFKTEDEFKDHLFKRVSRKVFNMVERMSPEAQKSYLMLALCQLWFIKFGESCTEIKKLMDKQKDMVKSYR